MTIHHEYPLFDVHWCNFKCERGCVENWLNSDMMGCSETCVWTKVQSAVMALHKIQCTDYEILD